MNTLEDKILFEKALSFHQNNDLASAKNIYEKILLLNPLFPDALHNLAVLYIQENNFTQALPLAEKAYQVYPNSCQYRLTYIELLLNQKKIIRAWEIFEETIEQGIQHPALKKLRARITHNLPAPSVQDTSRLEKLFQTKKYTEMFILAKKLHKKYPYYIKTLVWLGLALIYLNELEKAILVLEKALKNDDTDPQAWATLGLAFNKNKKFLEAEKAFEQALKFDESNHQILLNAAKNLYEIRKLDDAFSLVEKAVNIKDDQADCWFVLANIAKEQYKWEMAEYAYRNAIRLNPRSDLYLNNLASLLKSQNKDIEAIQIYRQATQGAVKENRHVLYSNLLFSLCHIDNISLLELETEHKKFGQIFNKVNKKKHNFKNSQVIDRPLKVGFISADLYNHSVAYFLDPLWQRIDTNKYMIYVYSMVKKEDSVSLAFKNRTKVWRDIVKLTDDELEKQIRSDQIDILIDLSGHTAGNRLPVFARKPAPVQMTWLGYPFSTGLSAIDYYIGDNNFIPKEIDDFFSEKIIRLPCATTFAIPQSSPKVSTLPFLENRYITFGSFNRSSKLTDACLDLWSQVLKAIPNSKLLIGAISSDELKKQLQKRFEKRNIDISRVFFEKQVPFVNYLELHAKVDIILDTLPYTGGTTTNYALMMGVPIITLAGNLPAQRQGVATLMSIDLSDWVAYTNEDYIKIAIEKTKNVEKLAQLRAELRHRCFNSEVRQAQRFTYAFELALNKAWAIWLDKKPAQSFEITKEAVNEVCHSQQKSTTVNLTEGWLLFNAGKNQELEFWAKLQLEKQPNIGKLWHMLGLSFIQRNLNEEAKVSLQKAASLLDNDAEVWDHLGVTYNRLGAYQQSYNCFEKSLALNSNRVETLSNAAKNANDMSLFLDGERYARKAVELSPTFHPALNNLGWALNGLRRPEEAISVLSSAINKKDSKILLTLGSAKFDLGNLSDAMHCYSEAVEINPNYAEAHNNLANTLKMFNRYTEALTHYQKAVSLKPNFYEAMMNLAGALQWIGRHDEAIVWLDKVLAAQPDNLQIHANKLFALLHLENVPVQYVVEEHFVCGAKIAAKFEKQKFQSYYHDINPVRKLRIGFVSGDLRSHPVANFIMPIFMSWNHQEFDLFIYSTHVIQDSVTEQIKALADMWDNVAGLSALDLANLIYQQKIDILIDLSGHTAFNRLDTFSLKPAPIQISYIGYPMTTGLYEIDYYLADKNLAPPGMFDTHFTEKLVYLNSTATFQPEEDSPDVNILPALTKGFFTFGSFNRPSKINQFTISLWSKVLLRIKKSILVVGGMGDAALEKNIRDQFLKLNIEPERLIFLPRKDMIGYLTQHHEVDLLLDTFPYTGGTTTNHALWMGVPTLTMVGDMMPSRQGAALMNQIGLNEFVVSNPESYVKAAQYWSENINDLSKIRSTLRERILNAQQRDADYVYNQLALAFRHMWKCWCERKPPTSFMIE